MCCSMTDVGSIYSLRYAPTLYMIIQGFIYKSLNNHVHGKCQDYDHNPDISMYINNPRGDH